VSITIEIPYFGMDVTGIVEIDRKEVLRLIAADLTDMNGVTNYNQSDIIRIKENN
jgi:hypothetical protein